MRPLANRRGRAAGRPDDLDFIIGSAISSGASSMDRRDGRLSETNYRRFIDFIVTSAADPELDRLHRCFIDWLATWQVQHAVDRALDAELTAGWRAAVARHARHSFAELQRLRYPDSARGAA